MITRPHNLKLTSKSFSRSELEAGLSLIRAFFPETKVRIIEAAESWDSFNSAPAASASDDKRDAADQLVLARASVIEVEAAFSERPYSVTASFYKEQVYAQFNSRGTDQIKLNDQEIEAILASPKAGKETERKVLLKHGLFHLLAQVTGHIPPWGILTGIRPSKILHRLNDLGIEKAEAQRILEKYYLIREDKVRLLQKVVEIQRPFLKKIMAHPEQVAVYVGIPFCPTRCTYCSFPAYSLQRGREPLHAYLKGLYEEIRITGAWMKETGCFTSAFYMGGGTPTILTISELTDLLQWIRKNIPMSEDLEFSVEAGRPDTLSKDKLQALREQGVNRLSINPQTMHNHTLKRIGRAHSVEDIVNIYALAREIPGWEINMDLILGLPGESVHEIQESLQQIGELKPDNLTVHVLSIKRGSKEHEAGLVQNLNGEMEDMQKSVLASAQALGMHPYYLYRQKHIAGNLENIGFALPGAECGYNIGIMEERQSVIGLGAGASSKIINPEDYSLVNLQHPSNWQVYLERWREIHQTRVMKLSIDK
ncbi:coproporphyrinogen dehydrogenase HemZ [Desulfitobacterium sp. Sab5]|uniref:coproporphyrinogen dehydrogenase HemZ n=1 Tax=Desulfitobacterium nosdiversum TaxID=3375356 RepID=UPI003CEF32CE